MERSELVFSNSVPNSKVKLDVDKDGHLRVLQFIANKWTSLCLRTFQAAFNPEVINDILCSGFEEDEQQEILKVRLEFSTSTVKRFLEFSLLYESYPWAFHKLLLEDVGTVTATLEDMKADWEFLLSLEAMLPNVHQKWPMKQVNPVRWQCYREVMTFCEERGFASTGRQFQEIKELIQSWLPSPMSTLGCDSVFRQQRQAEKRHSCNKTISVEQLQALAVKSVNERYSQYETIEPRPSDVHSIAPNAFLKRSLFDASRSTANDTGLHRFNNVAKASTPSPHHLTRKGLNLWKALKRSGGSTDNFWTAQLVRSGSATWFGLSGVLCLKCLALQVQCVIIQLMLASLRLLVLVLGMG